MFRPSDRIDPALSYEFEMRRTWALRRAERPYRLDRRRWEGVARIRPFWTLWDAARTRFYVGKDRN